MADVHDYFRLSFRENPISAKRIVFFSTRLSLLEPLLLCATFYGRSPLLSVVEIEDQSNNGYYIYGQNSLKHVLNKFFPDYEI